MITFNENVFELKNDKFQYVMRVLPSNHLAHIHFGEEIVDFDELGFEFEQGSSTSYEKPFSLGNTLLEFPTFGKGDYREPALMIEGYSTLDFKFKSYEIKNGKTKSLPHFNNECETLIITLLDEVAEVEVDLEYNLYETVITKSITVRNFGYTKYLTKIMSMNLDFYKSDFKLLTLNGAWVRERHVHLRELYGVTRIDSKKGVSSADHNPFFALTETGLEAFGNTYGFGLVYSGNFEAIAEVNTHDLLRMQMGINSFDFRWKLDAGESFETPEVVLTYSKDGLNGMSQNFHEAIKKKFLRGQWKNRLRPVKVNNWEATYFDFNERKLLQIAKQAKKLGIELFVLDDGWFGKRNDDTSSLGDYSLNTKKIKSLPRLIKKVNGLGLDFGIWVEPEMVSIDSDLYRNHPDWAITEESREPVFGRNQLVLDLTKSEVRDYIIKELTTLFSSGNVAYCKWDMNRNFSDVDRLKGEYYHRYVLGLYEVLDEITDRFPDILFESCSSGGNRFDLGMLYYMPQTWTSDNTDGLVRQNIQYGTSMIYPPCTMANHVSSAPNHQTFRNTPLETRFNVASFGVLGYELDLTMLTSFEKKVIRKQIEWYKKHRELLQYGTFTRVKKDDDMIWMVGDKEYLIGHYQGLNKPNPGYQLLHAPVIDGSYVVENRTQFIDARTFGSHINLVLPFKVKVNGIIHTIICNNYLFKQEELYKETTGKTIQRGIDVMQRFTGTGHNDNVRLNEDFASRIYSIKENLNE